MPMLHEFVSLATPLWLETLTATWMAIEAAVSTAPAFSPAAFPRLRLAQTALLNLRLRVVLLWRSRIELQQDAEFPRPLESEPAKSPFCSLTAYAIASAGDGLSARSARLPMRSATVILALARMMTLRLA
jgi:hypothetical protein